MRLTRRGRLLLHLVIYSTAFAVGILSGPYAIYSAGH